MTLSSLGFNTPWGPTGGIDSTDPSLEGVPNVGFNNYSFGVPPDTLRQFNNTIQIIDNVTKIIGTHTLQFGGDYHYDQINERNTYGQNGQFGFGGQETGYDFADYLIGAPKLFHPGQLPDSGFPQQILWLLCDRIAGVPLPQ